MILDCSAIIAILLQEPDAARFAKAIESAPVRRISAVNYIEAAAVIDAERDSIASRRFDDLLQRAEVEIAAATPELARGANSNFGRGSGHPATLNFGDRFAYALSVSMDKPLLCKGDEFLKAGLSVAHH
jgi:ribonuclease VapC